MYDGSGRVVGGNATDQALMRFLGQETFHKLDEVSSYAVTKSQSFNSANKFSQAYIAGAGRTFYKGAPEKFLAVAQKYLSLDGDEHPLDLESLNAKIDELAGKSMRVLAFGYSPSEMTENAINADTVLIGLVGIRDDVRPEAREAIAEVQKAGIQVVMITGDRLETAVAIAREAGLLRTRDDVALTSTQLNELSDDEVKKIIPRIRVIARALPTDKSRMVRLCQELNLVVGMTGDGVNDSPGPEAGGRGLRHGQRHRGRQGGRQDRHPGRQLQVHQGRHLVRPDHLPQYPEILQVPAGHQCGRRGGQRYRSLLRRGGAPESHPPAVREPGDGRLGRHHAGQ
ncbi:MAG: HAD family hydrolase [Dysosmobacter sp.]